MSCLYADPPSAIRPFWLLPVVMVRMTMPRRALLVADWSWPLPFVPAGHWARCRCCFPSWHSVPACPRPVGDQQSKGRCLAPSLCPCPRRRCCYRRHPGWDVCLRPGGFARGLDPHPSLKPWASLYCCTAVALAGLASPAALQLRRGLAPRIEKGPLASVAGVLVMEMSGVGARCVVKVHGHLLGECYFMGTHLSCPPSQHVTVCLLADITTARHYVAADRQYQSQNKVARSRAQQTASATPSCTWISPS